MQVRELFYSRVEAAYSLQNRSGYQVVYQSPDLPAAIGREIENNLRCFDTKSGVDLRYQYFHLSSGDVALAICQRIDEINTRITDRAGRGGPFVGHCLIVNAADFAAVNNDPFLFFNNEDQFVLEPEAMVAVQANQPLVREFVFPELVEDETHDYIAFDIEGWKQPAFSLLWQAAADAATIVHAQRGLAIQGDDEDQIYTLLQLILHHLPASLRFACTFNTFVDNCNPPGGVYWALGGFRRAKLPGAYRVRLDRASVDYQPASINTEMDTIAQTVFERLRSAQGLDEENN